MPVSVGPYPRRLCALLCAWLVVILSAGGCAAALTDRVSSDYEPGAGEAPTCTDAPGLTVVDATLATTYVQLGAWWLVSWESELLPAPPAELLVPLFGLAGAHAASALYGYNQTLRCKTARFRHQDALFETNFRTNGARDGAAEPRTPKHERGANPYDGSARGDGRKP